MIADTRKVLTSIMGGLKINRKHFRDYPEEVRKFFPNGGDIVVTCSKVTYDTSSGPLVGVTYTFYGGREGKFIADCFIETDTLWRSQRRADQIADTVEREVQEYLCTHSL